MRFAALLTGLLLLSNASAAGPQRVVSLGICTDRLAVALLPAERIAALSREARDPRYSPMWQVAAMRPAHDGSTEGVLAYAPDLVLASAWGQGRTLAMLERLHVPVLRAGLARGFDDIRAEVRAVAATLGTGDRAEAWIAALDRGLAQAAARPRPARPPLAAYLMPDGLSAGRGTLVDAALRQAGYENLTARLGYSGWGVLALENVVAARPDALVLSYFEDDPRLALRVAAHPVLRGLAGTREIAVPSRSWLCGDPYVGEAVSVLAEARP